MAYTLISFVGTGMYKEGYRQTTYVFPGDTKIQTHIFFNALLRAKYREVSKIVLVGTKTSGWDMLIDIADELWIKTCEAKERDGVSGELIVEIEKYLSDKIHIPVIIKCHSDVIDNNTSLDIFNLYNSIVPEITDENILFDITHGFRSMPILLYQALQFSISQNQKIKNVEIVYGEYIESEKESYVRNLSNYWKYSQISDAFNLFKEKLDGVKLAAFIEPEWKEGAKAIRRLSEIVQTNFSLQIVEVGKQINNALKKYPENAPQWLDDIRVYLSQIHKTISADSVHMALYNYAVFLYERKLNVQAIVALQIAVESFIAERENKPEMVGNYEWWQTEGRGKLNEIKRRNHKEIKIPLTNLEAFRNQIAHGGGLSRNGGFPQAANIPNIYNSGIRGIENLFKIYQ